MRKKELYYKVPEKYDQFHVAKSAMCLVKDELFTLNEIIKHGIPIDILIPILVSPDNTYIFFECRFEEK